jgi:hypothetical protein
MPSPYVNQRSETRLPGSATVRDVAGTRKYFDYPRGRVDYLTHISVRRRCVFVEVPKAGCSVVKRALQFSEVEGQGIDPDASVHDRALSPLAAPVSGGFDLAEVFGSPSSFFRFSFVRNPYSRALSCYLEKIAGEQWLRDLRLPELGFAPDADVSFPEFLRRVAEQEPRHMDIHWAPQHHLLSLQRVRYDFLGRFENFHADLKRLVEHLELGVPEELLNRRTAHVTNAGQRLTQFYDQEAVELVQEIYRGDFDTLGYGRDPRLAA